MGLSERFKDKLTQRDIFASGVAKVRSISPENSQPQVQIEVSTNKPHRTSPYVTESIRPEIENLETQIIEKIRKTPYWDEYSKAQQQRMIGSYFDKKCSNECFGNERNQFIQNIIDLANCK